MKKVFIICVLLSFSCAVRAMNKSEEISSSDEGLITLPKASVEKNKKISFYISYPQGEYWSPHYGKVVIKAEEYLALVSGCVRLRVIAPESFKSCWRSALKSNFVECKMEKRARNLSRAEYLNVIHKLFPSRKPPKGLEFLKTSNNWGKAYLEWKTKRIKKSLMVEQITKNNIK